MKDTIQAALCTLLAIIITSCAAQSISGNSGNVVSSSGPGSNGNVNSTSSPEGAGAVKVTGRSESVASAGIETNTGIEADVGRTPPTAMGLDIDGTSDTTPAAVTSPPSPPSADNGEEGAARLVSRVDVNGYVTGTLQVFFEGAWGAVCGSNFDDRDAMVACRQLGFSGGISVKNPSGFLTPSPASPEEIAPFALENLGCSGNESLLVDCPVFDPRQPDIDTYSAGSFVESDRLDYQQDFISPSACDPFRLSYARILCGTDESTRDGSVRLAHGAVAADGSAEYGRLEVSYRGGWGTVCDSTFRSSFRRPDFTKPAAGVACRQLGFKQGRVIPPLENSISDTTQRVPIVLPGMDCRGSEQSVSNCPDFDLGLDTGICSHANDVHLHCFSGSNPEMDGATRLVGGAENPMQRYEYGRLEVFAQGFWSKVCSVDRFPPNSAQVACRALGYDGGVALWFTEAYTNSLKPVLLNDAPVALAAVDCEGTESSISECKSIKDATFGGKCFGERSSTLVACSDTATGCDKKEGSTQGAVRLRGGFGTLCDPIHSGFIEILNEGEWGSICTNREAENDLEDLLVADVACRQMGFPHGTRVNPLTAAGKSSEDLPGLREAAEPPVERYWLSSVACAGMESRLVDCDIGEGFRQSNAGCMGNNIHRVHIACRKFPVVEASEAVATEGADEGNLRLVDDARVDNWVTGRLQMFFEGSWSRVCPFKFDLPDITVACRQLGFGAGTTALEVFEEIDENTVEVAPELAIVGASCNGTEERLIDCEVSPPRVGRADDDVLYNYELPLPGCSGVQIACVNSPREGTEGEFRLANRSAGASAEADSGILEVFHAGAWGTICDLDPIRVGTAKVACRGLGFEDGFFSVANPPSVVRPPWLANIRCSGNETDVSACMGFEFGATRTCGPGRRGVKRLFCFNEVSSEQNGQVRLAEGRADPGGLWQYGRLEVLINGIWSIVDADRLDREGLSFLRTEAIVACRTLGFTTGVQMLVGDSSPYPAPLTAPDLINSIFCGSDAEAFSDCKISFAGDASDSDQRFFDPFLKASAVALTCASPTGCVVQEQEPKEGDVRLVRPGGRSTSTCDEVHMGAVQVFRKGRWGGICLRSRRVGGGTRGEFGLDAQVVCRQLGFLFGTVIPSTRGYFARKTDPVWASEVVCKGSESRLLDCFFPEQFGGDNDRGINIAQLHRGSCSSLSVMCRQFEIIGSAGIRR